MQFVDSKSPVRFKRRELELGQSIVLLEPIHNGPIQINAGAHGKIVYLRNQIEADILFPVSSFYFRAENLLNGVSYQGVQSDTLHGMSFLVNGKKFAIHYDPYKHKDLTFDKMNIPFLKVDELPPHPSARFQGDVRVPHFLLEDIIENIEQHFENWVLKNAKFRRLTKREKEDEYAYFSGETILKSPTDELIVEKKEELELAFARATGLYYTFSGGLIWD